MTFSEKLSAARKSKGFSQEELAAEIEVSRQAISKWENGTAQPETANILKLCEVLEVSPNELFGFEEKSSAKKEPQKQKSGKTLLIIIAAVILFAIYLIWVDENRDFQYQDKTLPISITNLDIHVLPEQPEEGFLYVELTAYFETVKSYQTFGFLLSGTDFEGNAFTEEYSASKIGPTYDLCSSTIKVPIGGEIQLFVTSTEGIAFSPRSSQKLIGRIYNITEEGISFESYPDNKEY